MFGRSASVVCELVRVGPSPRTVVTVVRVFRAGEKRTTPPSFRRHSGVSSCPSILGPPTASAAAEIHLNATRPPYDFLQPLTWLVSTAWGWRDHSKKGATVLAYDFPLLSLFWSMLMFFGLFLMIWLIIWCFVDNFRRRDHHGLAKAGWTVVILFIPILGALIYIVARPASASLDRL